MLYACNTFSSSETTPVEKEHSCPLLVSAEEIQMVWKKAHNNQLSRSLKTFLEENEHVFYSADPEVDLLCSLDTYGELKLSHDGIPLSFTLQEYSEINLNFTVHYEGRVVGRFGYQAFV
jgi:hypothetical protein